MAPALLDVRADALLMPTAVETRLSWFVCCEASGFLSAVCFARCSRSAHLTLC